MVAINKRIIEISREIIYLILMIILSYLIWNSFEIKESKQIAFIYNQNRQNLSFSKSERSLDEENKTFIKIENENNITQKYDVLLSVNFKEQTKLKDGLVTISTKEISLNDIENNTDKAYINYKIISDSINYGEIKSYFVSLNTPVEYDIKIKEIK